MLTSRKIYRVCLHTAHRNILIFTISDFVTIYHPYNREKDNNLIALGDSDCSIDMLFSLNISHTPILAIIHELPFFTVSLGLSYNSLVSKMLNSK